FPRDPKRIYKKVYYSHASPSVVSPLHPQYRPSSLRVAYYAFGNNSRYLLPLNTSKLSCEKSSTCASLTRSSAETFACSGVRIQVRPTCDGGIVVARSPRMSAPFRCLAAIPHEGGTRAGILRECPDLDRGSREAEVGFEPRTLWSVNSRSNHLDHLAPEKHCIAVVIREATQYVINVNYDNLESSLKQGSRFTTGFSFIQCEMTQWLQRKFTDRKVRGSNPASASQLSLSRLGQPGSITALVLPSNSMAARHRKGATAERSLFIFIFYPVLQWAKKKHFRWSFILHTFQDNFVNKDFNCGLHLRALVCSLVKLANERMLDPTMSKLGQPGGIPTIILPSGGVEVRHQKVTVAERYDVAENSSTDHGRFCPYWSSSGKQSGFKQNIRLLETLELYRDISNIVPTETSGDLVQLLRHIINELTHLQINLVSTSDSTEPLVYDTPQLNVLHTGCLMFQLARYSRYRISRENQIDLQMSVFFKNSPIWVQVEHKTDGNLKTAST
ncbi:hypothetical protein T265_13932, partial [Opisthorchis viverrini]